MSNTYLKLNIIVVGNQKISNPVYPLVPQLSAGQTEVPQVCGGQTLDKVLLHSPSRGHDTIYHLPCLS